MLFTNKIKLFTIILFGYSIWGIVYNIITIYQNKLNLNNPLIPQELEKLANSPHNYFIYLYLAIFVYSFFSILLKTYNKYFLVFFIIVLALSYFFEENILYNFNY
ncbi:hypothetical protein KCTC32516_02357 [Polaribacter huanghezhanensis]|nr:hypothetical protein KCTC32516_02357 [Polaribacter huanghezhanensis]